MSEQLTPNPSVPTQIVQELKFPKYINNLGIIPTSYKDSMSYYECLAWLCKYLEETVIPTLNQNGEAVEELQGLYIELNSYVTHYFDNLDVQQEIDNKLDQLVADGTLYNIIYEYQNETNELIANYQAVVDSTLLGFNEKINNIVSGVPAGAYDTLSDLETANPPHNKVYVVKANNNWYYYDTINSEWTSGGVYGNQVIGTKAVKNVNLQNNIIPVEITKNLYNKNFITKGYYLDTNDIPQTNANYCYSNYIEIDNSKTYYIKYILNSQLYCSYYDSNLNYISREVFASNVSIVATLTIPATAQYIRISTLTAKIDNIIITESQYSQYYPQTFKPLGNIENITIESCNFINKLPNLIDKNNVILGKFISYVSGLETVNAGYFATNFIKIKPNTSYELSESRNAFQLAFYDIEKRYISGNYQGDTNPGIMTSPTNAEYVRVSALIQYLDTISYCESSNIGYENGNELIDNIKINENNIIKNTIYVGANEEYTSLKEGIEKATETFDSTVIVRNGTYNLYNEFGGDDFFDNYDNNSSVGIILKNRVKVIFENGAKVTFNYTGNNQIVTSRFSPFNSGVYGYELYNATVECTNCRYCLHDEQYSQMAKYISRIENCKFTITTSGASPYSHFCIGMGLGHNGDINIKNNYCNTTILIHNNASTTDTSALSNVVVKDNYLEHGTCQLEHCGASQLSTQMLVSNNSVASDIIVQHNQSAYIRDNIVVYKWNNEIHS